jgi:hypothetical protein
MNATSNMLLTHGRWSGIVATLLAVFVTHAQFSCLALIPRVAAEDPFVERSTTGSGPLFKDAAPNTDPKSGADQAGKTSPRDVAWLGVSTTEASEALSAQLDLAPGVGLVVSYLSPGGPAAKAGLKKNDVLVRFEDQSLVHPSQLRKLVRAHKAGDTATLTYYRAGKEQQASVALGNLSVHETFSDNDLHKWHEQLRGLQGQLKDLHLDWTVRDQMNAAREAFGNLKWDQEKVQEDIRRSMETAQEAFREALKSSTNSASLNQMKRLLDQLTHTTVAVANNAKVTVRTSGKESHNLVNTDDSGTIVLVANPRLHLTAHDRDGKLLFDGEIQTQAQRDKVPRDLWARVEPLLEKIGPPQAEADDAKPSE